MYDTIGTIIGTGFFIAILSPLALIFYLLATSGIDVDGDGKSDTPHRWDK
jgi:hypothetical protein